MIRPATADDWTAIERLLITSDLPLDGARSHLRSFVVAEHDGKISGCAALERYGTNGLLRSVAVDATRRGNGVGEELVRQILNVARAEGIESVVLLTTTASEWFPRFGFRRATEAPVGVKASAEFRGACPESAVLMSLDL